MQLTINGKQLDVGDALRGYIEEQLPAVVGKYFENPTDGHVTMSKQGTDIRADVTVHVGKGILLQGHALAGDAYAAFDEATEHVGTRLRRYKRRLRDHHRDRADNSDTLPALMFRNISHGGLNMIYRRADGNIGWIDPRGSRGGVPEGN